MKIVIKSYESRKNIMIPIIFFLVGLLFVINPFGIIEFISYILGGVFITLGVSKFIYDSKKEGSTTTDTFYSIVLIVIGLLFIIASKSLQAIGQILTGSWLIINGVQSLLIGINHLKVNNKNALTLIVGISLISVGTYIMFVEGFFTQITGVIFMIYGVLELINTIHLNRYKL